MAPPDWVTLRIFLAALELGSVTRAADRCGIATSADVVGRLSQSADGVVVDFGGGNAALLSGLTVADVGAAAGTIFDVT